MIHHVPVRRRTVLGAGLGAGLAPLAAALAACTGEAAPAQPGEAATVSILTGLADQPWEAYLDLAEVDGHFAEQRLTVEVHHGEGTGRNLILLEAGQVQFATADIGSAIIEYSKGVDPSWTPSPERPQDTGHVNFVLVSQLHSFLLSGVASLASSDIRDPRDLAGRTVAVIPGGAPQALLPALARAADLDPSQVRAIPGDPSGFNARLATGDVDATVTFLPEVPAIEADIDQDLNVIAYLRYIDDVPGSGIAVSRELAESNPDLVRRFNRAVVAGLQAVKDDPERAGRVWWQRHEGTPGWTQDLAIQSCHILAGYLVPNQGLPLGHLDEARVLRTIGHLESVGNLYAGIQPDDVARFDLAG